MKGVSCTASNRHEICLVCYLTYNNIFPEQLYSLKNLVKTFRCGMVPCSLVITYLSVPVPHDLLSTELSPLLLLRMA